MCNWIICMQVSWETATPWSTLPSWCQSFVSLPDRARRWRQTSSTSGWVSGEEPAVFLVILNLGSSKTKTQDTNIFLHQLPQYFCCVKAAYWRASSWPELVSLLVGWNKWGKKLSTEQQRKSFCCSLSAPMFSLTGCLISPSLCALLLGLAIAGLREGLWD